jgi:hypothetical protein
MCFAALATFGLFGALLAAGPLLRSSNANEAEPTGTRNSGTTTTAYCPIAFTAKINGVYYYEVGLPDGKGNCIPNGYVQSNVPHQVSCPDCPDPIFTNQRPVEYPLERERIQPKPDPLFAGVLR